MPLEATKLLGATELVKEHRETQSLGRISAVSRALAILEDLSVQPIGTTVSELVMRLGIEKSVVSRILNTLENDGYVQRNKSNDTFHIGLPFAAIALRHIDEYGITDFCIPLLRELAQKSGELVQLAIVQGNKMIYIAKAEGHQRIRVLSLVGQTAPPHCTTVGKVWLASLPEVEALSIALEHGLEKFTDKTIATIDQLRSELVRTRKNGYALVEEEMFEGTAAVAVPVRDRSGDQVIGGIVLSGPLYRLPKKRLVSFVPELEQVASKLTELGNIDAYFGSAVIQDLEVIKSGDRLRA